MTVKLRLGKANWGGGVLYCTELTDPYTQCAGHPSDPDKPCYRLGSLNIISTWFNFKTEPHLTFQTISCDM